MFSFLKSKTYSVLRLYHVASVEQARLSKVNEILDEVSNFAKELMGIDLDVFSMNYMSKTWNSLNRFSDAISKKDEVVYFYAGFKGTKSYISYSNKHLNTVEPSGFAPIEITIVIEGELITIKKLTDFLTNLGNCFEVDYGYIVNLKSKSDFIREGLVANSNGFVDNVTWNDSLGKIKDGYIKRVYQTNIISEYHLANPTINSAIEKKIGTLTEFKSKRFIWFISLNELPKTKIELQSCTLLKS